LNNDGRCQLRFYERPCRDRQHRGGYEDCYSELAPVWRFMPEGIRDVFEGKCFWKMPADVELDVGPAVIHPLPATYLKATEQGSGQTKITPLAAGRLNIEGYRGGLPFPNPSDDATPPVRALGPSFHRSVPFLRRRIEG
jgi:hypothetical protein